MVKSCTENETCRLSEPTDPDLSIVIPVFNEGANIRATLESLYAQVQVPKRVYVVYDFEEDDTLPVVRALQAQLPELHLLRNRFGRGAHSAIRTGLLAPAGGVAVVMMADLSDDVRALPLMYEKARAGAMVVCASRYSPGGRQIGGPWLKGRLSRLAGWSLHHLVGLPTLDVTNSFKAYRRELLDAVTIESDGGFEIGMELVVKAFAAGYRVEEVPCVSHADRPAGSSRFQLLRWFPKYLRWWAYAVRNRPGRVRGDRATSRPLAG
ncbi:MAG: glycosyltransferase family 2 protein [Deltaproteobacteria bacterium]|nr:glycosyltransferase family 2 protein [Deltaproteobacteria bacterium]